MADLSDTYCHVYKFLEIIGFVMALLEKNLRLEKRMFRGPRQDKAAALSDQLTCDEVGRPFITFYRILRRYFSVHT